MMPQGKSHLSAAWSICQPFRLAFGNRLPRSRRRKERRRQRPRFLPAMAKTSVRRARTPHRGDAHNARLTPPPRGSLFAINYDARNVAPFRRGTQFAHTCAHGERVNAAMLYRKPFIAAERKRAAVKAAAVFSLKSRQRFLPLQKDLREQGVYLWTNLKKCS